MKAYGLTRFSAGLLGVLLFSAHLSGAEPDPGHSHQGPAFDFGPRRFATLTGTSGNIDFAEESCSAEARAFINQGIGQLHGFLNYESERSFLQAAYIEPSCAMAYWGMAMANTIWSSSKDRALEFIGNARRRVSAQNSEREILHIEALENLRTDDTRVAFASVLRRIWENYPQDLDAKAFYVMTVWSEGIHEQMGYHGTTIKEKNWPLYQLAQEVLAVRPDHPVHHYVIHMWDNEHFSYALDSADRLGFAGPGVAHMWHMAGHTYSQAGMLFEKWWSQEAAARVDHRYMAEAGIFPFMLHNHAHNNEWFSRTLQEQGAYGKSVRVAGNLLSQPRHPVFNQVTQYQHLQSGANRMLELIERGEYWQLGTRLFSSPLLACQQFEARQDIFQKCLRTKSLTALFTGREPDASDLSRMHSDAAYEIRLVRDIISGSARRNVMSQLAALPHLAQAGSWGFHTLARYARLGGRSAELLSSARGQLVPAPVNVPVLLEAAYVLKVAGEETEAATLLDRAKAHSQELDLEAPAMKSLAAKFSDAGIDLAGGWKTAFANWRAVHQTRPRHDALGPLLWQVPVMPDVSFATTSGISTSLSAATEGAPAVVVYSLAECQHCDLQIQDLMRRQAELDARGVRLVTVLSEPGNLQAFREAGVFDDFESIPLHGLFIIDGQRRILWQDISADVFEDIDFLMTELDRALDSLTISGMSGAWDLQNSH